MKGKKTGGGSRKGVPNKATAAAREAIAKFVDGNAHRLQEWLDRISEKNPEKAFQLFQSVIEYHVPRLARSEIAVDDDSMQFETILRKAKERARAARQKAQQPSDPQNGISHDP